MMRYTGCFVISYDLLSLCQHFVNNDLLYVAHLTLCYNMQFRQLPIQHCLGSIPEPTRLFGDLLGFSIYYVINFLCRYRGSSGSPVSCLISDC